MEKIPPLASARNGIQDRRHALSGNTVFADKYPESLSFS
jgi:hypothetical protein